ncbi:helix-turn-helix transcriptional regulator [Soonwooa sp.]|uniref:helix-turn-helix domain-containing protein n=1 Tax=Soonwooa sp. TaxID=1938592 RepID=UPI0028B09403|nr:helix-turn-helix transcriptional regulator [Soonwooa sp.]
MSILRLKEVLAEKGMQNKDLADKIGVTPTTISNITQGNNFPKPETLLKIAEALDVDIRELFQSTKEDDIVPIYIKNESNYVEVGSINLDSLVTGLRLD